MHIRRFAIIGCVAAGALLGAGAVAAADDPVEVGRQIVTTYCARCHAVGPTGDSPFAPAPHFRDLYLRYDVEALEEALVEGIITGHPDMPVFEFAPPQAAAIVAYLKSLEPKRAAR